MDGLHAGDVVKPNEVCAKISLQVKGRGFLEGLTQCAIFRRSSNFEPITDERRQHIITSIRKTTWPVASPLRCSSAIAEHVM